jgi:beta-glucanase (GH16 family)
MPPIATRTAPLALAAVARFFVLLGLATAARGEAATGCGSPLQKSTGVDWACTFADDFSGSALNRRNWVPQRTDTSGFSQGQTSCFLDSKNNISVANGSLTLTVRRESKPVRCRDPLGDFATQYTSGMVSTWEKFSQAYGRFEIRAKVWSARVKGLQSAFWLWPVDSSRYGAFPASGEIDIAELFSAYADRAVPYIHYTAAAPDPNVTSTNCMITDLSAFHTYAVEWTPSSIEVIYDGTTCLIDYWNPASPLVSPQPFDQPFIVALTQALGVGNNAFDPATTPLPASTVIDYVHVWN